MAARARPGRDLYQRGSLRFLPGQETVPLLVDHDDDREIGIVRTSSCEDKLKGLL
jgi:hypothetical protein